MNLNRQDHKEKHQFNKLVMFAGQMEIVELLIQNGANVTHDMDHGISALHLSAKNGKLLFKIH